MANIVDGDDACEPAAGRASNAHEPLRGDVEMEALRGAVASNIERALATLTPDARAVVLLDLEGFTENEAAEMLGCPSRRISKARVS